MDEMRIDCKQRSVVVKVHVVANVYTGLHVQVPLWEKDHLSLSTYHDYREEEQLCHVGCEFGVVPKTVLYLDSRFQA